MKHNRSATLIGYGINASHPVYRGHCEPAPLMDFSHVLELPNRICQTRQPKDMPNRIQRLFRKLVGR